jgi:hypothetical protein
MLSSPSHLKSGSILETLRPEDALLLWSVRRCPEAERTKQIKSLLGRGLDWPYVRDASSRHGLLPLLFKALEAIGPDIAPNEIWGELKAQFRMNALRNLFLAGELIRLNRLFAENGISSIPYKGPTLAVLAYGDVLSRQFDDLDILVHKGDVLRVKRLLLADGYRPEVNLTPAEESTYLKSNCEYNFHSEKGIHLEIHWDLLPNYYSFPFDLEGSWSRLAPVSLEGAEVFTFSAVDLLPILCSHYGCKHLWERLGWVLDFSRLIEANREMKWQEAIGQANRMGLRRTLSVGLFLARDLIGIDLPELVLTYMESDPAAKRLSGELSLRLFQDLDNPTRIYEDQYLYLRMRERFVDKVRYLRYLTFTPNVKDWQLLGPRGHYSPVYALIRPFRLIGKYGLRLLKCI